jgi:hypothetical protein
MVGMVSVHFRETVALTPSQRVALRRLTVSAADRILNLSAAGRLKSSRARRKGGQGWPSERGSRRQGHDIHAPLHSPKLQQPVMQQIIMFGYGEYDPLLSLIAFAHRQDMHALGLFKDERGIRQQVIHRHCLLRPDSARG